MRYTAKPEHLNTFDVTHGGAVMTLLDIDHGRRRAQRARPRSASSPSR